MEIERKFMIREFPKLQCIREALVWQSYISIDPEIRIRKIQETKVLHWDGISLRDIQVGDEVSVNLECQTTQFTNCVNDILQDGRVHAIERDFIFVIIEREIKKVPRYNVTVKPEGNLVSCIPEYMNAYILTFKGDGSLCRAEVEIEVTESQYNELISTAIIQKPPIVKQYRIFDLDGKRLECSLVDDETLNAFMYAEVEFDNVEDANAFIPPTYLSTEITNNADWKMKRYWERTRN